MWRNQFVDLRTSSRFASREMAEAHDRACAKARATQRVRYAVAPGASFVTADGRALGEGAEVRLEDFTPTGDVTVVRDGCAGIVSGKPRWKLLEDAIHAGLVIEADHPVDDGPKAA